MAYFIVFILLLLIFCMLKMKKKVYHPAIMLYCFWSLILFFGGMRLLGEDRTSYYTYAVILIGLISFGIGCWRARNKLKFPARMGSIKNSYNSGVMINAKIARYIFAGALIYCTYNLIIVIPLMADGMTIANVRRLYLVTGESSLINSGALQYFLQNDVYQVLQTSCIVIGVAEFLYNRKKSYIIAAIFTVLVAGLTYGSRIIFIDVFLYFVIGIIIIHDKKRKNRVKLARWQKIIIIAGVIGLIGGVVYITSVRQGGISVLKAAYNDYTCCIRLLDISISQVLQNRDITWGVLSIRGIIEPFVAVFSSRYFGRLINNPTAFSIIAKYTRDFVDIGSGQLNNAYVSAFFYFYLDGRLPGVIILSFICGYLSKILYNRITTKEICVRDLCFYLLVISMIFRSMIECKIETVGYFWAFVLLHVIYNKSNKCNILRERGRGNDISIKQESVN